jgi:Mg2+-importing ATPase
MTDFPEMTIATDRVDDEMVDYPRRWNIKAIRSRKPFFKSRPGKYLLIATLLVVVVTLILPFSPLGRIFGFCPLRMSFLLLIGTIVMGYIVSAEIVKTIFYKTVKI